MQLMSETWHEDITTLARSVVGKVELHRGSTLAATFLHTGELSSIKIERTPVNGAFFGFVMCQKAIVVVLDPEGTVSVEKGDILKPYLGTSTEFTEASNFIVSEVEKNEVQKTLTIIAYDIIEQAAAHTISELQIEYPIATRNIADMIAAILGTTAVWEITEGNTLADTVYDQLNFSGIETLRDVLGFIAQATGTICFIKHDNRICFKQLTNNPVFEIDKTIYFEMSVGKAINLTQVTSATDLGDNLTAGVEGGKNQVFYDNPFLTSYSDPSAILTHLLDLYAAVTMYPYTVKWRSNPALEFGDCVKFTLADDTTVDVIYLGETINYNGGMSASSSWEDEDSESVDGSPTTLGDALKQTYAKVDKANKQIELVASEAEANAQQIAAIQINTDSINQSVSQIQKDTTSIIDGIETDIAALSKKVESSMTAEEITFAIQTELQQTGVDSITTKTGYSFNENGLNVSKTGSEMSTLVSEDGMTVSKDEEAMLVANNQGVVAVNLHAKTYLLVGQNSRFEDYADGTRTGCFWLGQ
jgi:hypothetical protein